VFVAETAVNRAQTSARITAVTVTAASTATHQ